MYGLEVICGVRSLAVRKIISHSYFLGTSAFDVKCYIYNTELKQHLLILIPSPHLLVWRVFVISRYLLDLICESVISH